MYGFTQRNRARRPLPRTRGYAAAGSATNSGQSTPVRARSASPTKHMLVTRARGRAVGSKGAESTTFWPLVSQMKNVHVIADLPWRWFREGNVVHVRGSVKLQLDPTQHQVGVAAFDVEALPLRAARFDGYRHMQAMLTGFIRNSSRTYPLYGVPHGNMRSIRCYFDIDEALLQAASQPTVAMISGNYDI